MSERFVSHMRMVSHEGAGDDLQAGHHSTAGPCVPFPSIRTVDRIAADVARQANRSHPGLPGDEPTSYTSQVRAVNELVGKSRPGQPDGAGPTFAITIYASAQMASASRKMPDLTPDALPAKLNRDRADNIRPRKLESEPACTPISSSLSAAPSEASSASGSPMSFRTRPTRPFPGARSSSTSPARSRSAFWRRSPAPQAG